MSAGVPMRNRDRTRGSRYKYMLWRERTKAIEIDEGVSERLWDEEVEKKGLVGRENGSSAGDVVRRVIDKSFFLTRQNKHMAGKSQVSSGWCEQGKKTGG